MSSVRQMAASASHRLADEDWEELKQDIPKLEEPFLQQYFKGQQALIAEEKSQRSGMKHLQSEADGVPLLKVFLRRFSSH